MPVYAAIRPLPLMILLKMFFKVGMDSDGEFVVNPEMAVAASSPLNLTIAGTA